MTLLKDKQSPSIEPPRTKVWPLPLILTAIEVRDPVYREWVIDRMVSYIGAGLQYVRSLEFIERPCEREDSIGQRVNLGGIIGGMDSVFII
jgi:hypothetical protein